MEKFYKGSVYRGGSFTPHRTFTVFREGEILHWELTQNQYTKVDLGQFEYLNQVTWSAIKATNHVGWYVTGGGKHRVNGFKMHQYLAGIQKQKLHFEVDHEDRDPLNNTLSNLRLATRRQQQFNLTRIQYNNSTSGGLNGVRVNRSGNYQAYFNDKNMKFKTVGTFSCKKQAAFARDEAVYEEFKNDNPLEGLDCRGITGRPTLDFLYFNYPERLGLSDRKGR